MVQTGPSATACSPRAGATRLARKSLASLAIALWLGSAGCLATSVPAADGTPLRDFLSRSRAQQERGYRVQPGDQLSVRFYYNPQLDQDFQVRPDGTISLSLVGELSAAGKTARELSDLLSQAYAQYFTKSGGVVIVRASTGYRAFTAGQLNKPGQIDIISGAKTVLESLAVSGGLTEEGTLSNVYLIRKLPGEKSPLVAVLNLKEALSGEDPSQDVELMPDDFVFVPRSGAATVNLAMQQYLFRNLNFSTGVGVGVGFKSNTSQANRTTVGGKPSTAPNTGSMGTTPAMPATTPTPTTPTTPTNTFTPARP